MGDKYEERLGTELIGIAVWTLAVTVFRNFNPVYCFLSLFLRYQRIPVLLTVVFLFCITCIPNRKINDSGINIRKSYTNRFA